MFRPTSSAAASRALWRSLNSAAHSPLHRASGPVRQHLRSQLCTLSQRPRGPAMVKPLVSQTLQFGRRQATTGNRGPVDNIDKKYEEHIQQQKLHPDPASVSSTSTTNPVFESGGGQSAERDTEMLAGVKHDLQTIRDTFSLEEVPKEAYYIGLAGVLPYLATSVSTFYCAWEINHAAASGMGFLMSEKTAELLLHILEPLQIGYGATIISFLGAIHWGLEWAGYGGHRGYPRYFIGVISTGLAWPTILLPVEYALISQFLIFNFLYYTDSRASKQGWAPPWYGVYRFVLTFIVGSSIVLSLVGRGQIADRIGRMPGTAERIQEFRQSQMEEVEDEEAARRKYLSEGEGEGEDEEEESSEGGDEEESE